MPVDLSAIPDIDIHPKAKMPWWGWMSIGMLIVTTGAIISVLTWPQRQPTATLVFWGWTLVLPALSFACLYALCNLMEGYSAARIRRFKMLREDVVRSSRAFAQEPLSVIAVSYLTALGTAGVAAQIAAGESALGSRPVATTGRHTRYAPLAPEIPNQSAIPTPLLRLEERVGNALSYLIGDLADALGALSGVSSLEVTLSLPAQVDAAQVQQTWSQSWRASGLLPCRLSVAPGNDTLMVLDDWLDEDAGPALAHPRLWIAVHITDTPEEGCAECAVAILLGWPGWIAKRALEPIAMVHRPVECSMADLSSALSMAAQWGKVSAEESMGRWQCGDGALSAPVPQAPAEICDVRQGLGHSGAASAWLGLALAAEHASHAKTPQLLVSQQGSKAIACVIRNAVSQPAQMRV